MTLFRTHCVETNWAGGCVRSEINCDVAQRTSIFSALSDIRNKLNTCTLTGIPNIISSVRSKMDTVVFNCDSCSLAGQQSDNEITICNGTLSGVQNRINAVVFHELIHAIGGTELDSEAFENHCYRNQGATAPTSDDFPKFRSDGGNFVNWDMTTGSVTLKSNGIALNVNNADFIDPTGTGGGGGGGWI